MIPSKRGRRIHVDVSTLINIDMSTIIKGLCKNKLNK